MPPKSKSPAYVEKYGLYALRTEEPAVTEMDMVKHGGRFKPRGKDYYVGNGLFFHFKEFIKLVWPHIVWHKWADLFVENWINHKTIACLGPASSGKSFWGAACHLADYYIFPDCTTTICCSTIKEMLEQRVWGEIKKLHGLAQNRFDWIPGRLINYRNRIVTNTKDADVSDQDIRCGLLGVPCKKGNTYVGIADLVGIKNKRVRLMGDELSMLPPSFLDCLSNLRKNPDFKVTGMGNPKETTDALGILAEPAADIGGWDGGIDQSGGTKTWRTRQPDGIAIQLVGSESPNLDGQLGIPLITQQHIDADVALYGKESWQFTMMNEGRMPHGQGQRRILTRQFCIRNHALEEPVWENINRTKIAGLDAAYRGVGGDRCVYVEIEFGNEAIAYDNPEEDSGLVMQHLGSPKHRQIIAITKMMVVPIVASQTVEPEDQIVEFVMGQARASQIPPENFWFDAGMRTSLVTAFGRVWNPAVNSIDFGGPASEDKVSAQIDIACRDYYSKFVTQLWFDVRMAVECQQVRGLPESAMMEFAGREWTLVGGNKMEVEPKHKMRVRMGRSPDEADAIACAFHGARKSGFVISKLTNIEDEDAKPQRWRQDLRERAKKRWQSGRLTFAS